MIYIIKFRYIITVLKINSFIYNTHSSKSNKYSVLFQGANSKCSLKTHILENTSHSLNEHLDCEHKGRTNIQCDTTDWINHIHNDKKCW